MSDVKHQLHARAAFASQEPGDSHPCAGGKPCDSRRFIPDYHRADLALDFPGHARFHLLGPVPDFEADHGNTRWRMSEIADFHKAAG